MQLDQELEPFGSSGRKRLAEVVTRDLFKYHFRGKFEKTVQLKDLANLYMTTGQTTAEAMAQFGASGVLFEAGRMGTWRTLRGWRRTWPGPRWRGRSTSF
jgi:hypothetical protein